jgi:hypothetical protein
MEPCSSFIIVLIIIIMLLKIQSGCDGGGCEDDAAYLK